MTDNLTAPAIGKQPMKTRLFCSSIILGSALMTATLPAEAAQPETASEKSRQSITRIELERHALPGTNQEMVLYEITVPAAVAAPVHHHPTRGLNYIIEGTVETAFEDEKPTTYRTGDHFQDKAIVPHTEFKNTDAGKALKFLVFYTLDKGEQAIITP